MEAPSLGTPEPSWSPQLAFLPRPIAVAVRSRFDGRWCRGFDLVAWMRDDEGASWARVRRRSDRSELPEWLPSEDIEIDDDGDDEAAPHAEQDAGEPPSG